MVDSVAEKQASGKEASKKARGKKAPGAAVVRPLVRKISSKGQVSIPKAWLGDGGFNEYATIAFTDEGILVKPIELSDNDEFDALILRELIAQGLEGDELVDAWAAEKQVLREGAAAFRKHVFEYLDDLEVNPDLESAFGC